ncbi:YicC/YloC family endoribonuclease [Cellulosilyticum sp. I15G10I2]|uniref:YicC/YloC family endoribonuclease n=1 Tax=Cellulosilyticum sp. I15G10I2 TaxID=1892843 RepID=UPI00085CAA2E|nr:YicC/YloC family endoribonuclease [Cellulosilyticum sp. I15G10I2]
MIYSMTGYGRCEIEENQRKVTVEMSAINHRYLDINMRMPKLLAHFEEDIRKIIKKKVARGKLDLNIYCYSMATEDIDIIVNENICKGYIEGFSKIAETFNIENDMKLSHLMQVNDLITIQKKSGDNDEVMATLTKALETALDELLVMRLREGEALKADILQKTEGLNKLIEAISSRSYLVVDEYKRKLEARIASLLENVSVDPGRIAAEVVLFADKCAVDEELTRLKSHIVQLVSILEEDGAVGRKLDFLMQEINREANTIGSKANDYTITKYVVSLKTEVEKIREQVQNIE